MYRIFSAQETMNKQAKMAIHDRYNRESKNPSFSSVLLDEIYRSMDEGTERSGGDSKFYRETTTKERSRRMGKLCEDMVEEEDTKRLRPASLIETWMEKHVSEKVINQGRQHLTEYDRKCQNHSDHDLDQDGVLFSSTSISSDSSFGGFSSSDTESIHGPNSLKTSCLAPTWLKPIRTGVHSRPEKLEKKQRAPSYEHGEFHMFEGYRLEGDTEKNRNYNESMIKSKSRALKIYSQLKKVKDPISPGGRVANFLNSLFTTRMAKKTKNAPSSSTSTTCSSASSFSRSCLSKHSLSVREGFHSGGDKRAVRFYPVSVIADEDCRPSGHKSLYEENESSLMAATVSDGRSYGRLSRREEEKELEVHVNEAAREIQTDLDFHRYDDGEEEEDDAESCCSSDLFELDHNATMELPVYETTRFDTNFLWVKPCKRNF